MVPRDPIKLTRDCEVVQIPEGFHVRIARGTEMRMMQSLGDTYTLMTEYGTLVRLEQKDCDAIGMTPKIADAEAAAVDAKPLTPDELKERVWGALRNVFDPEIPINVVELGLVYRNEVVPLESGGNRVIVDMTLTAPGCGMGHVLQDDAERRISKLPGVKEVAVQIVIEPQWNQHMMTEAARLELGL